MWEEIEQCDPPPNIQWPRDTSVYCGDNAEELPLAPWGRVRPYQSNILLVQKPEHALKTDLLVFYKFETNK